MTKNLRNVLEDCRKLVGLLATTGCQWNKSDMIELHGKLNVEIMDFEEVEADGTCSECGRMRWREHRKGCQRGHSPLTNA